MKDDKKIDYKALRAELDEVLDQLQQDDTDIDAALKGYEKGLKLIGQLETYLQTAENTIKKLQSDRL